MPRAPLTPIGDRIKFGNGWKFGTRIKFAQQWVALNRPNRKGRS
jgi:hypothetical protein